MSLLWGTLSPRLVITVFKIDIILTYDISHNLIVVHYFGAYELSLRPSVLFVAYMICAL